MAKKDKEPAVITIPADYLEDMRSALVAEVRRDSDMLRANQEEAVRLSSELGDADRDSAVEALQRDLRALEQLLPADPPDRELLTDREIAFHALESMCRLLTDRLVEEMEYGPLDMLAMLNTATRMEWAARQAMAIYPELAVTA